MNNITIEGAIIKNEDVFKDDMYVDSHIAPPYPGYILTVGSAGGNVSIMQSYLNAIRNGMFPGMTRLAVDGIFGNSTKSTVMQYQGFSGLKQDGIIGPDTWNSVVEDYNTLPGIPDDSYPGRVLRSGSVGVDVGNMQMKLNGLSNTYTAINSQIVDEIYGRNMTDAVRRFQHQFGLKADGVIGRDTWDKIIEVYNNMLNNNHSRVSVNYPGYILTNGSAGDHVRYVQSYMNRLNKYHGYNRPVLSVDGIFGSRTKQVVAGFQNKHGLKADGIVGKNTWDKMINEFNNTL